MPFCPAIWRRWWNEPWCCACRASPVARWSALGLWWGPSRTASRCSRKCRPVADVETMSLTWRAAVSGCLVLLVAGLAGCVSGSTAKQQRQQAFEEGRQKALQEQTEDQTPVVLFRGDVRNTRVPWREGLTLA